jgi:hypothetical protein
VNQLLREVLPVMIPLMAPRPMGSPTRPLALDGSCGKLRTGEDGVPSDIEEYFW